MALLGLSSALQRGQIGAIEICIEGNDVSDSIVCANTCSAISLAKFKITIFINLGGKGEGFGAFTFAVLLTLRLI